VLAGLEGLAKGGRESGSPAPEAGGTFLNKRSLGLEGASQPTKPPILSRSTTPGKAQSSSQPPLPARPASNPVDALKAAISNRSPMLASLVEHALDVKFIEKGIEIQFASQNKFHCEMLQAAENVEVIKELAASVVGEPQQVKIVMVNGPSRQSLSQSQRDLEGPPANPLLEKVKDDSDVKAFLQVFQGEITDVKDLKK